MMQHGLGFIDSILAKDTLELTELEKRLIAAIFWFGEACKDGLKVGKFVKSVIALESLLTKGEEGKPRRRCQIPAGAEEE